MTRKSRIQCGLAHHFFFWRGGGGGGGGGRGGDSTERCIFSQRNESRAPLTLRGLRGPVQWRLSCPSASRAITRRRQPRKDKTRRGYGLRRAPGGSDTTGTPCSLKAGEPVVSSSRAEFANALSELAPVASWFSVTLSHTYPRRLTVSRGTATPKTALVRNNETVSAAGRVNGECF